MNKIAYFIIIVLACSSSSSIGLLGNDDEKVSTECLQFFGGNGFSEEYPLARMYRDCRVGTIGAGTSEIMREIIAKAVIDDTQFKEVKS